jgi:two-component system LytT family sensor kinase
LEKETKPGNKKRRLIRGFLIVVACWTFLGLLFTPQTYLSNLHSPTPFSWWQALLANSVLFYLWAAFTPLVLWLGRRFLLEQPYLLRNLVIHFGLSFLVTSLHLFLLGQLNYLVLILLVKEYVSPVPAIALAVGLGATNIMIYWGIIGISQALAYFRRSREREISLAQARLQAIQTQLHPHFLFNTLNAISELVHEDAMRAEQTITQLSDLLRISLQSDAAQEITLKEELDFLRKYVEIQQTLLQERLTVNWNIEPDTLDAQVPNLLLQPLIENAIRHGIAPKATGGTIEINADRRGDRIMLSIEDDGIGIGFPAENNIREGIGLKSVRTRLRHLYDESHEFSLKESGKGQGLCVEMVIPFRENKD